MTTVRARQWGVPVALMLLVATSTMPAQAQDASDRMVEARELFERGIELADAERWAEALTYFRRSRAIAERSSTIYNMGVALHRLGRLRQAADAFEDYLRVADVQSEPERHADVRRHLRQIQAATGRLTLTVDPPDAEVDVDGEATSATGAERIITLDPGDHRIRVSARGFATERLSVASVAGDDISRSVRLEREDGGRAMLVVHADVSVAEILVDGEVIGTGDAQVAVAPGEHQLTIEADGYETFERELELAPGERRRVDAALSTQSEGGGVFSSPAFWILTGVIVAGAAVTALLLATRPSDPLDGYNGSTGVVIDALSAEGR